MQMIGRTIMMQYDEFFENEMDCGDETVVEYDITTSPRDLTPANIVDMIDSGIIEIPLFQRNYVWDIKKASKLVESLILGLPVPELFFYSEGDENSTYKIIDGQQRLLSIYFFVKGRFPKSTDSRLMLRAGINAGTDLEALLEDSTVFQEFSLHLDDDGSQKVSRYHGKKFKTLDKDAQIKFRLRRYLRTVVVRQNKPDNNSFSMFEIFNRLNTGGTPLNHQEIRASLYYCKFYEMLVAINEVDKWRALLGKPVQDLHCNDVELILRSLALLERGDSYVPKMVTFLNSYSQESKKFSPKKMDYLGGLFISFVDACDELGDRAFFRNNRFSKTLFECVFVATCRSAYLKGEKVHCNIDKDAFERLKNDEIFISYLQSGSSSTDSVKNRLKRAAEVMGACEE